MVIFSKPEDEFPKLNEPETAIAPLPLEASSFFEHPTTDKVAITAVKVASLFPFKTMVSPFAYVSCFYADPIESVDGGRILKNLILRLIA
jgi:hypothetical protein